MTDKKIAIVVQRYGAQIVGGAELHARMIAEFLADKKDVAVTVLTTCANSYQTWRNTFKPGVSYLNNVKVIRHRTLFPRFSALFGLYSKLVGPLLKRHKKFGPFQFLLRPLEAAWFILQGPFSPALVKTLKETANDWDQVIFFTYLYYPTLQGTKVCDKPVIIPTAHDELAFYFSQVPKSLQQCQKIFANGLTEKNLIDSTYPILAQKTQVLGLPIQLSGFLPRQIQDPYVLFLGRISEAKNLGELLNFWKKFVALTKTRTVLVLAGEAEDELNLEHPSIRYLGRVDTPTKNSLIKYAEALINPSKLESLSMVCLEAMSMQIPILAHQDCSVFREYNQRFESFRTYGSSDSFLTELKIILTPEYRKQHQDSLIKAQQWVSENYSWRKIESAFLSF